MQFKHWLKLLFFFNNWLCCKILNCAQCRLESIPRKQKNHCVAILRIGAIWFVSHTALLWACLALELFALHAAYLDAGGGWWWIKKWQKWRRGSGWGSHLVIEASPVFGQESWNWTIHLLTLYLSLEYISVPHLNTLKKVIVYIAVRYYRPTNFFYWAERKPFWLSVQPTPQCHNSRSKSLQNDQCNSAQFNNYHMAKRTHVPERTCSNISTFLFIKN